MTTFESYGSSSESDDDSDSNRSGSVIILREFPVGPNCRLKIHQLKVIFIKEFCRVRTIKLFGQPENKNPQKLKNAQKRILH